MTAGGPLLAALARPAVELRVSGTPGPQGSKKATGRMGQRVRLVESSAKVKLYPDDWPEISRRIREVRAQDMCECRGECGHDHTGDSWDDASDEWLMSPENTVPEERDNPGRCPALNRLPHPVTGSKVVLTVAHLDHQPEHCDDDNLRAMCQRCHLAYDRDHHAATRAANRAAAATTAGQLALGGAS